MIKTTTSRYVRSRIKADVRNQYCEACRANKKTKYTKVKFEILLNRGKFKVIHIEIAGPFPEKKDKKYLLTIIDTDTSYH